MERSDNRNNDISALQEFQRGLSKWETDFTKSVIESTHQTPAPTVIAKHPNHNEIRIESDRRCRSFDAQNHALVSLGDVSM